MERLTATTKICFTCKKEKPHIAFHYCLQGIGKLQSSCKECQKIHYKQWGKKKPSATKKLNNKLKHLYGITLEEYNKIKAEQNNKCKACGKYRVLVIDHDHKTKKFRGLICHGCNIAIGMVKEDTETLKGIIAYLETLS